jgi:hypothetical protein
MTDAPLRWDAISRGSAEIGSQTAIPLAAIPERFIQVATQGGPVARFLSVSSAPLSAKVAYFREDFLPRISRISRMEMDFSYP